jgi:hypothetical protein
MDAAARLMTRHGSGTEEASVNLTAAEISAIHHGAAQVDTHNDTVRSVATQLDGLPITPDYMTTAGVVLDEVKQNLVARMGRLSALLDNHSASMRAGAGAYQATQDDTVTQVNPLLAMLG